MSNEVKRNSDGTFIVPPKSPGRPKAGQTQAELFVAQVEPHRQELIDRLIAFAKAGDMTAMRILMDRLAPADRPGAERVVVPGMADAPTLQAKADCIIAAVANGDISAEAGRNLLSMIDVYRSAVAHDDIERRLRALEDGKPAKPVTVENPAQDDSDFSDLV